ncbi:hypothetical protein GCM10027168_41400 [Streptomyces capparidis]
MPFTLSHAAAVLPLVGPDGAGRGPLLAAALVAGSFAPDAPYYADTLVAGTFWFGSVTHRPWGVVTVDVLITAALVGVWLGLREPLVALLPSRRRGPVAALLTGRRWRDVPRARLAGWFWVSASAGAATHVGWDAFTHDGRAGVRLLPVLREDTAGQPLYWWVQYAGSALALAVMAWWAARALRGHAGAAEPAAVPRLTPGARAAAWTAIGAATCAAAGYRCARWYAAHGAPERAHEWIPTVLFGAGAGFAGALVLYAAAVRVRSAGRARERV